MKLNCLV